MNTHYKANSSAKKQTAKLPPKLEQKTAKPKVNKFDRQENVKTQNRNKFQEPRATEKPAPRPAKAQNNGGQREPRVKQIQKVMEVDLSLLVQKAVPQAIVDYSPSKTFAEHGLAERLVISLTNKGYTQPTPIQDKIIPHILQEKNVVGIANTGTGKTAAFLLPLLHQVYKNNKKSVLILAPTRELATQIFHELKSFLDKVNNNVSSSIVIGGENIDKQINDLKKKKNFVIATTGRGLDLINQGYLRIKEFDTIVLDEMDQMLDMGFIADIRKILKLATNRRHLLFFSATTTASINKIVEEMIPNPTTVSVVQGRTSSNIHQDVVRLKEGETKMARLCQMIAGVDKVIVFENTKHGASKIEKELVSRGFLALAIHGNKNQNQRTRALSAFKSGAINILIATNVAARGLDIPMVSMVINYGLPQSKEDYVHRIGRTGRAGEIGYAYTFLPDGK